MGNDRGGGVGGEREGQDMPVEVTKIISPFDCLQCPCLIHANKNTEKS